MTEWVAGLLLLLGGGFLLLAAVGVTRMPDLFTRMQTTTKAATLGMGATVAGVAVYFGETGITARAAAIILFVFLTAPVAAHMIGRAAYMIRVPLWEGTLVDELREEFEGRRRAAREARRAGQQEEQ